MLELDPQQNWTRRRALGALATLALPAMASAPLVVVHQGPESAGDHRKNHAWKVLEMALEKTCERWGPYRLVSGPMMNDARAVHEVDSGAISVTMQAASIALERKLLPIRIPVDKGMLGCQVFLIRRELQGRLDRVQSLDDLRGFTFGCLHGGKNADALATAGLKVVIGSNYEGLFSMLSHERFDLLSRSISEAPDEIAQRQQHFPNLTVERNLLLSYPLPSYLFVRRNTAGEQLATRIGMGVETMIRDGSFDRLFWSDANAIEQVLRLKERRLLAIQNPMLSPDTPLGRSELWYQLPRRDGTA